jgi:hypothetical protein
MQAIRVLYILVAVAALCAWAGLPIANGEKILFIGNSLTNNGGGLDNWVEAAGAADDPSITINADRSIMFATELSGIYNNGAARDKIANGSYDIVVLQGWDDPVLQPDSFHKYVDLFDIDIKAAGSQTVLFMTWPIIPHGTWALNVLNNHYNDAGDRIGAPVVHVGTVWWGLRRRVPPGFGLDTAFLFADDIHPNDTGQYLNSLCFYSFFTQESPEGVDYEIGGFSLDDALEDTLQARAWKTIALDVQDYVGVRPRVAPLTVAPAASPMSIQQRVFLLDGSVVRGDRAVRGHGRSPHLCVVRSLRATQSSLTFGLTQQ